MDALSSLTQLFWMEGCSINLWSTVIQNLVSHMAGNEWVSNLWHPYLPSCPLISSHKKGPVPDQFTFLFKPAERFGACSTAHNGGYVLHNPGICVISRLRCAFSESQIACQSRDCTLGLRNLEIAWHQCAISRLCGTSAQSGDSAISVVCTIEPFEFPSCIKVRDVRNKLLQLHRHLQCRACILKPPHQGLLGSSPTRRNSLPLVLGTGAERSQTCVQGITISESCQLSSVSQLGLSHPISPLRSQIALVQSRDCANVLRNSEIAQTYCAVSRLAA